VLRVGGLATDLPWQRGDQFQGFVFIPNQTGTYVIGKLRNHTSRFTINSDGWNATRDYTAERASTVKRIAVIGDSYVLALNVDPSAAMSALVEKDLLARGFKTEVYPFGNWSASAGHYLAIMRYARARFSPDLYIINLVHGDIPESFATLDRAIYLGIRENGDSFEEVPPRMYAPSFTRRLLGHFAIARYLEQNLQISRIFQRANRFQANVDISNMVQTKKARALSKYIFQKYLNEVDGDPRRLVIVMDAVREAIYSGIHPSTTSAFEYNKVITATCQELSLYCLDLTDSFWSDYQVNKRRFNSVLDGHWDEYGQQVAARALEGFLVQKGLLVAE